MDDGKKKDDVPAVDPSVKDGETVSASPDSNTGSSNSALGLINHDTARVLDHRAERALCRKFDIRLLPVLAMMCKQHPV